MKKIIFPGSFDPPTLGHLDIALRAANIFDHVYIAIGQNPRKKHRAFSPEQRMELLSTVLHQVPNVEIVTFNGLLADFANTLGVKTILRAIRNASDFDYENLQAQMNSRLGNVESLYMVADEKFRLISSALIHEIAGYGRRLHGFVPEEIEKVVFERLSQLDPMNELL